MLQSDAQCGRSSPYMGPFAREPLSGHKTGDPFDTLFVTLAAVRPKNMLLLREILTPSSENRAI